MKATIRDGTEVEVSENGVAFDVTPVPAELREVLDEMDEQYADVFHRLADS